MLCLSYGRSGSHRFYFWYRRQHRRRSRHLPARLNDLQKSKLENPSKNNQNHTSLRIILTFCTNIELGADGKTYHEYVQALQHCGASAFENVRFFCIKILNFIPNVKFVSFSCKSNVQILCQNNDGKWWPQPKTIPEYQNDDDEM